MSQSPKPFKGDQRPYDGSRRSPPPPAPPSHGIELTPELLAGMMRAHMDDKGGGLSDAEVESEQARAEQYLDRFERLERRVAELEKIIHQLQGGSVASGDAASESGVDR